MNDTKSNLPHLQAKLDEVRAEKLAYLEKYCKRIENAYLAYQLLAGEGVNVTPSTWDYDGGTFKVDVKELPAIRRALGRLEKAGTQAVDEPRNRTKIWVMLRPCDPQFQHIGFKYMSKLKKGAKCKIMRRRSTYVTMVCE